MTTYPQLQTCFRLPEPHEVAADYDLYHTVSMDTGDVDPSYEMLRYVCRRFELNTEQRYWMAFLYATCYCGPTAFYIYNEFPDFENVDEGRLCQWWDANRSKLYFQTDRRWVRSRNQWVDVFRSYRRRVGKLTQAQLFRTFQSSDVHETYHAAWEAMSEVYQFGRFAMFLYLEAVHVVTGFPMLPKSMNLDEAESCRNGLALAIGRQDLFTHDGCRPPLTAAERAYLQGQFNALVKRLRNLNLANNVWNIETTLCAYKKYRMGKRWVGYYLDRQAEEIKKMEKSVPDGVDWTVLWEYRAETYRKKFLMELR